MPYLIKQGQQQVQNDWSVGVSKHSNTAILVHVGGAAKSGNRLGEVE